MNAIATLCFIRLSPIRLFSSRQCLEHDRFVMKIEPLHCIEVGQLKQAIDMSCLFFSVRKPCDHETGINVMKAVSMRSKLNAVKCERAPDGRMPLAAEMVDKCFFVESEIKKTAPIVQ